MKRNTIASMFFQGFMQAGIPFLAVFGVAMAFVAWRIDSGNKVPTFVLLIVLASLGLAVCVFSRAFFISALQRVPNLPRVSQVVEGTGNGQAVPFLVILEPSEMLIRSAPVSFFYIDQDDVERFVGLGRVLHIQGNGLIQVEILDWKSAPLLEKLQKRDASAIKRLRVRPSIPDNYARILGASKEEE